MNFYPPPETIIAKVYCEIPKSLRCVGESTEWLAAAKSKVDDIFLEGPLVDKQGNLYVVDIPFGRVLKISPDGHAECSARWDGEPNGLALLSDGRMGIMLFDPQDNTVVPHLTRRNLERFKGPNDLIVDSKGNIYFTDQGQTGMTDPTGRVYRYSPDKKLDCLVDNGASPNGLVLSPDEEVLYVAMTRANQVWRLPLHDNGTVTKVGVFFQGFGMSGPDGLAVDQEGNLFICMPGLGTVFVVDERGIPLMSIRGEEKKSFITNCTFGGPENKTLFMTSSIDGKILKVDWHCPGARVA
ncbi:uncharacterized protein PV07_06203 [Cladophialophora immunda]|uniref:SMP-30/Gluconolactonase/LRE-like region domain-containing protein n=1 Tax=Cladophialophora immunda TaxID=569365 RepID=A0A0D1ZR32_9EURO|nr:uncharacterized protein PV07_06203 [Cladophialophora immunda]KIW30461.1 hypothetical protein PV07_06203 [Cladophialophora immunda]